MLFFCSILNASNTVKVGWPLISGLQEYDKETGVYSGYNYEYLNKISKYCNFDYEFYIGTMNECEELLKNGEIDILGPYGENSAIETTFDFFDTFIGGLNVVWITQKGRTICFEDFFDLNDKSIGILNQKYEMEGEKKFEEKNNFNLKRVLYNSEEEIISALDSGEIEIAQVSSGFDYSKYKEVSDFNLGSIYFLVNNDKPKIRESMENAINAIKLIEPDFQRDLCLKYDISNVKVEEISFSSKEKEYLETKPVVRVIYNQHYLPLLYNNGKGECSGFLRSYMNLVSQKSGIKFEYNYIESPEKAKEMLNKNEFDVFLPLEEDSDCLSKQNITLTQSFFQIQFAAFINSSNSSKLKIIGLTKCNKNMASNIEEDGYEVVFFPDINKAVTALEKGQIDGYIDTIYSLFAYNIENLNLDMVEFRNYTSYYDLLRLGINKDSNPLLLSCLEKTIESINNKEINALLFQSTSSFHKQTFPEFLRTNIWIVLIVFLVFVIIFSLMCIFEVSRRKEKKFNIKLQESEKKARKANEEKTKVFQTLSHDIRTPMNVILNTAILGKDSIEDKKQTEDNFDTIEKTSRYLLLLINKLLDLSRLKEIDNKVLEMSFSLSKEVKEFSNQMKVIFSLKKQEFVFDIEIEHDYLIGDIVKIRRIIENLVNNAAKFTPVKGKVFLVVREKDGFFIFKVIDTGIGMTDEQCSHVFDAYYRVNNPEVNKTEGNGLGLLICKELVNILNGRIEVDSTLGKGTVFTVFLELKVDENKKALIENKKEKKYYFSRKKILIVEDNRMNQEILKKLLERVGITSVSAFNGQEGVMEFKKAALGTFDLILMDIRMPIKDGITSCKEIRALGRVDSNLPIIGLSGNNDFSDFEKGKNAGMNDYLTKPIVVEELYKTLEKLL